MEYVMMQSQSIAKLADALCKAQSAMKPAKKDSENPFFKSNYADLASVWEAIRGPLVANGLAVAQMPTVGTDGVVRLRTVLMHSSGEWIGGDLDMKPVKNDPQSIGSCLTYARRYALSAITGVATEDDDANAASKPALPAFKPVASTKAVAPLQQAAEYLSGAPDQPVDITVTDTTPEPFIWRVGEKYKGKSIEDIPLDYLEWFSKNGKVEDHRQAAQAAIDWANSQASLGMDEQG